MRRDGTPRHMRALHGEGCQSFRWPRGEGRGMKNPMLPRLITIPFSHYCEKARWALDRAGVSYVEDPYLPGLHIRPMRKVAGTTVPVLVLEGRTLRDSAEIMAYADEQAPTGRGLYPVDASDRSEV